MDRATFEAMIAQDIADVVQTHLPHGAGQMTETRLRTALTNIAKRAETYARAYYLGNLRTVDDMAALFGVSRRRAQAIAKEHYSRWGRGMMVGNTYIFSEDELESMRPGDRGRPAKRPSQTAAARPE